MYYIYIHGLGQTATVWDQTHSFMKEGRPLSCPDLPELLQGRAPTYENLYQSFSNYCRKLGGQLNLCGLSLGAVLALNYAIDDPQRVKTLALIGPQYKMPRMLLKMQNIFFRFMKESSFREMGFQKKDFIQLCDSMATLDFSKDFPKIQCPALVLCGEKDKANQKAAGELAGGLAKAELKIIAGAGHEVNQDAPKELASVLDAFYASMQ